MITSQNILDEKGIPLEEINAANSFKWNHFTVLVGENATNICKLHGDQLSVVLTIPIIKSGKSHPFAFCPSKNQLAMIVNHKLICLKTLESHFVKKESHEQPIPVTFIPHFEFEYVIVDLSNALSSQTQLYALFFEEDHLHVGRIQPDKLYVDSVFFIKNNLNILDNGYKLYISNIASMDIADLNTAIKTTSTEEIVSFFFEKTANTGDNDEWGFMKEFTESDESQISLLISVKQDDKVSLQIGNLFAGQFQDTKSFEFDPTTLSPMLIRKFDVFTKKNLFILGLDKQVVVISNFEFHKIEHSIENIQYAYFSPNLTHIIVVSDIFSSIEYAIFESESDICSRLKLALESKDWLDMIRFIHYPINNFKQHQSLPNRIKDTLKTISSYYELKTIVHFNPSPIQLECCQLLLVTLRDIPPLTLSYMNMQFVLHATSIFGFFYASASDLSLFMPILTELQFLTDDQAVIQFEEDAIDFIAPQVPFILDFMLYIIRDATQHQSKQPSHMLFFVHPSMVKLMLQLIVCIRSIQLYFKSRVEPKFKFLEILLQRTKLNLYELYLVFKKQKDKLENVVITKDQELEMLVNGTCPDQLTQHLPALENEGLVTSEQFLFNEAQWLPIMPPKLEDRILLFGSTCDLVNELEWGAEEYKAYYETQVDVVRKCKLYKDSALFQCAYCGRYSSKQKECAMMNAFEKSCFCGGQWIDVNAHLNRVVN